MSTLFFSFFIFFLFYFFRIFIPFYGQKKAGVKAGFLRTQMWLLLTDYPSCRQ